MGVQTTRGRRLRSDVLLTAATKGLVGLSSFLASVIAARALGPSARGIMAVALAVNMTLMQVGNVGLVNANPYFAARDRSLAARVIANSIWWAASLGTILIAGTIVLKLAVPEVLSGVGWSELSIVLCALPAVLATMLLQSVLLAEGRTVAYNATELALSVGMIVALLVAATAFELTVPAAVGIVVAQYALGGPIYYALLRRHRPRLRTPDLGLARRMVRYAFRVYLATVAAFLVIRVDLFLVNSYLGNHEAGLYSITAVIAEAMFLLPAAVGLNLFHRVARGADEEMTAAVFRSMTVLYAALCLVAAAIAPPLVPLIFGSAFADSATFLLWLLPGILALGLSTILSYHLAGADYPIEAAGYWVLGLAVNLALNVAFLEQEGTYFAALSSSITYSVVFLLHLRLFARRAGGYARLLPRPRELIRLTRQALGRRSAA